MAELVLGPVLRHVGETDATVWVETDERCEVEVLGHRQGTFHVEGHHYALVYIEKLERGSEHEYEVALDGERRWPPADSELPPSRIRTLDPDKVFRIVFGSCRVAVPHESPYTLSKDEDDRGHEVDALYALANRMRATDAEDWPHLLLHLGDQVYADEGSPRARERIRAKRDTSQAPGEEVADFEEYTWLYHEAWGHPLIRWLLSTVPSAMVFDDHDVHDDWNTSRAWLEEIRTEPWWDERVVGAFMSYWIYQHVGNLSSAALEDDELFARVRDADDAGPMLREFSRRADRETEGSRWSYCRELGRTKLVVVDSRAGRVLAPDRRCMVDDGEWDWIVEESDGEFDHLLIASTLPFLLGRGMHHLESWNEAVCDGAWGGWAARIGERIRQGLDLEHWAAFRDSFERVTTLLREIGSGARGRPPATIVCLGGDVHHAYLADVAFPRGSGVESAVYQAVCSPFRNPLSSREQMAIRFGAGRVAELLGRALNRAAGRGRPDIRWRFVEGPYFDNQFAMLEVEGRSANLRLEKTSSGDDAQPALETVFERPLA